MALVGELTSWAEATPWVSWLELSGSLGRGAGDEHSDVDAGIGVDEPGHLDDVRAAMQSFGSAAASVSEPFGTDATHVITVYRDGRQLSPVVMSASARTGIPPQAVALVDKTDRLKSRLDRERWDPDDEEKRRWTFVACLSAADALKHSARGNNWRAVRSLTEARDLYLQLIAVQEGVIFPQFGAVSLENAGRPIPSTLARTLPVDLNRRAIASAAQALVEHLQCFIEEYKLTELASALGLADR